MWYKNTLLSTYDYIEDRPKNPINCHSIFFTPKTTTPKYQYNWPLLLSLCLYPNFYRLYDYKFIYEKEQSLLLCLNLALQKPSVLHYQIMCSAFWILIVCVHADSKWGWLWWILFTEFRKWWFILFGSKHQILYG